LDADPTLQLPDGMLYMMQTLILTVHRSRQELCCLHSNNTPTAFSAFLDQPNSPTQKKNHNLIGFEKHVTCIRAHSKEGTGIKGTGDQNVPFPVADS